MSALDLDALEAEHTARPLTTATYSAADYYAGKAADDTSDVITVLNKDGSVRLTCVGHDMPSLWITIERATLLALITRLRAAEARTVWSFDMAAAEDVADVWAYEAWTTRCGAVEERFFHASFEEGEWHDAATGGAVNPHAWMPLPAAPEAP